MFALVSFSKYQKLPVDNSKFDYKKLRQEHDAKQDLIAQLQDKAHGGAPVEAVEEKKEEFKVVLETDEEKRGFEVFQKKCIVCHGKNAEGKKSQNAPKLAGQFDWYTVKQLSDMKAQRRINAVMQPYLKGLEEKDFKEIAAYLAKYPW
jgi:mono/diheme cytochrome c family protein